MEPLSQSQPEIEAPEPESALHPCQRLFYILLGLDCLSLSRDRYNKSAIFFKNMRGLSQA